MVGRTLPPTHSLLQCTHTHTHMTNKIRGFKSFQVGLNSSSKGGVKNNQPTPARF